MNKKTKKTIFTVAKNSAQIYVNAVIEKEEWKYLSV